MNANNAKDYLPLVQALAEGKVIQSRMFSPDPWKDCPHPDFTMDISNYRIKPEPREIVAADEVWLIAELYGPSEEEVKEFAAAHGYTSVRYVRAEK